MTVMTHATASLAERFITSTRGLQTRSVLLLLALGVLTVGLLPAVLVPMQNDDLVFLLSNNADATTPSGVIHSWFQELNAAGRTTFGTAIGSGLTHYGIWHGSSWLHLPIPYMERLFSMVWILLAVSSAAWFCSAAWIRVSPFRRSTTFCAAFFTVSLVLACVVQTHSRWSNDPVVSYPPWGFGSAAVGFAYLAVIFGRLGRDRLSFGDNVGLLSTGLLVAFWYEMLWPLFAIAMGVVALDWRTDRRGQGGRSLRGTQLLAVAVALPGLALLFVRSLLTPDGRTYSGTELAIGHDGFIAFARGVAGTIPGAAWPLAAHSTYENGTLGLDWRALLCTLVVVLAVAILALHARLPESRPHAFRETTRDHRWWIPVFAVLAFWGGCTVTIAFTEKYSQELYRLGTVYSFYVPATLGLAVLVFGLVLALWRVRLRRRLVTVFSLVAVCFLLVQSSLNWSMLDLQRRDMAPATRLMTVVNDPDASEGERCAVSQKFISSTFPFYAYPNDEVLRRIDAIHRRDEGTPWCSQ
jgi:hypothetical protein